MAVKYTWITILTSALEVDRCSTPRPGRFTPRKETRYQLHSRLCGPQGCSGRVRKISSPTGVLSVDRQARSESLYLLIYPGPVLHTYWITGSVGPKAGLDGYGKSRPPPGFDPWTVKPVASRYTYWAIPALFCIRTAQQAGWVPGPVWTGTENLATHRGSIPGPSSL
jgi:hypothetical protein